jgi:hypothetical protein
MRQRKEIAKFANIPGVTNSFVRHQAKLTQQHIPNPGATVDWVLNKSNLGYLPLDIELPWQVIRKEALAVVPEMIAYPATDYDSHGWVNFGIYTRGADDLGDHDRTVIEHNDSWTDQARKLMPRTVEYFSTQWPHQQFHKIRLLGLYPKGVIGLHSDDCNGLHNINIAIDHPDSCDFVVENSGVIPFENGRAFLVNVGRKHAVINNSNQLRIHLVVYQDNNDAFDNLVLQSYNKYTQAS